MSRPQHRLPAARSLPKPGALIAALDIGCSKVSCLIGRRDPDRPNSFVFLGGGRQQSRGFKNGVITDLEGLERAVRLAVEDAERLAGERIERVILGVTGPKLVCNLVSANLPLSGGPVGPRDVKRVEAAALARGALKDHHVLTAHPVAYRIDGQDGVRDPRGMHGDSLGVLVNLVQAPNSLLLNLVECVARAHLEVERLVPSAIATAMGTLIEDERDNGAVCLDLGAGVTMASIFMNGVPAWLGLVPAGGEHVTADLAQGLGTTFAAAERLKTVHGQTDPDAPGHAERIECPQLGDDGRLEAVRLEKRRLSEIIAPRIEETLEYVQQLLESSQLKSVLPRRAVLTGGASQLAGVRETASRILGMPVRLGRPVAADKLGENYASPAFSTASGLLAYVLADLPDAMRTAGPVGLAPGGVSGGVVNKAFDWLRENF
ncbi:MAG: cell division protein FtsA [Pseudomonadota bacterium]